MKLLNLGCGSVRPGGPEWSNLDDLHSQLPPGPERENLDSEPNYINHDVGSGPLPFPDNTFDGVLASHFFEHFECQAGLRIMQECRRVLVSGGVLLVSVPDAAYFLANYPEDCNKNWPRLFGVTDPKNPIPTFFEAALWFSEHRVLMDATVLRCYFLRAGLVEASLLSNEVAPATQAMSKHLNRLPFSVILAAAKP